MKGLMIIRKIAVTAVFVLGIVLLWKVEEKTSEKGLQVRVENYPEITSTPKSKEKQKQESQTGMNPQIQTFVDINKDVIGYISIPDTNVNYPVLMGTDNDYYLTHNIYGEKEKAACIMADYKYSDTNIREEFQRHTLIYGHYLTIKTMFTSVAKYKNQKFFESHPYIYYSNLHETGKWKVFSVYVLNADKETLERKFEDDNEYIAFLDKIKNRSWYLADVKLTKDSKILTLCTCSYETKNSRAIVHAVLVDE